MTLCKDCSEKKLFAWLDRLDVYNFFYINPIHLGCDVYKNKHKRPTQKPQASTNKRNAIMTTEAKHIKS